MTLAAAPQGKRRAPPSVFRRGTAFLHGHPRIAVAAGLVGSVALFYLPLLLGLRTFPDGDFVHHFLPFSLYHRQAIADLRLPLWNPYTYGGHPFLADTQAAVFYPLSNLLLALTLPLKGDASRLYLLQLEAILHTVLGGWFVYILVAEVTRVRWAALLAGVTFALSGYVVAYPPLQLAVLRTGIWLPLILWLLLRTARGAHPWGWALAAAVSMASAFFAGHPQTFLYIAWVTAAWMILLFALVLRDAGPRSGLALAGRYGAAALLAIGLSTAQWLPSVEFTRLSVRAVVDYAFVSGGFPLRDTWQLLLPGVFTQYAPLYSGIVALFLTAIAVAGVRSTWLKPGASVPWLSAVTLFFAGLALFGLLVSYGGNGPLYHIVYRILPGWSLFRGQERAAFLVALGVSTCAGIGASLIPMLHPTIRRRIALLCAALIVAAVYGFGLLFQLRGVTVVSNTRYLWTALYSLVVTAVTALLLWLPGWSDGRKAALLLLTVGTLFAAGFGINFAPRTPQAAVTVAPEVLALQAAIAEDASATFGLEGRVYNEFRAYEDYAMRAGLEDLWGSSPLRLARFDSLAQQFPLDRWWRLFGVEHVMTWRRELFVPSTLLAEYPQQSDTTYIHRLAGRNPRVWAVAGAVEAEDDVARELLADHQFDLESTAILPAESGVESSAAAPISATITLNRSAAERLEVLATLDTPGLLVLAENWMPGWRVESPEPPRSSAEATALGLPTFSVQRADLTLLGVPLPSGTSRFALVYDPASVRAGLWVSAGSLVLLAMATVLMWRLRRP